MESDNLFECAGGGFIFPDGTAVALENVDGMHRALLGLLREKSDDLMRALCNCAVEVHEAGLPGLAPEYLDRALASGGSYRETARTLVETGAAFERAYDLKAAADSYSRAMGFPESDPFVWYYLHNNLAYCLSALGRHEEAFLHCLAAVRADPGKHNAYKNLGVALEGLGRREEAAASYRHAYILNPEDERARKHLADLIHGGDIEEVPNLYVRNRALPFAGQIISELADTGDTLPDCRDLYAALVERYGEGPVIICNAIAVAAWHSTVNSVAFDFHEALDIISTAGTRADAVTALVNLADNLGIRGHEERARVCFDKAAKLLAGADDFAQRHFHNRFAWRLVLDGWHKEAERRFREAIRIDPWFDNSHRGLGIAFLGQGKIEAAEREIMTAEMLRSGKTRRLPERSSGRLFYEGML